MSLVRKDEFELIELFRKTHNLSDTQVDVYYYCHKSNFYKIISKIRTIFGREAQIMCGIKHIAIINLDKLSILFLRDHSKLCLFEQDEI